MNELEYARFLDTVDRLGELAELEPVEGLSLDALELAEFCVNVEVEVTA